MSSSQSVSNEYFLFATSLSHFLILPYYPAPPSPIRVWNPKQLFMTILKTLSKLSDLKERENAPPSLPKIVVALLGRLIWVMSLLRLLRKDVCQLGMMN